MCLGPNSIQYLSIKKLLIIKQSWPKSQKPISHLAEHHHHNLCSIIQSQIPLLARKGHYLTKQPRNLTYSISLQHLKRSLKMIPKVFSQKMTPKVFSQKRKKAMPFSVNLEILSVLEFLKRKDYNSEPE